MIDNLCEIFDVEEDELFNIEFKSGFMLDKCRIHDNEFQSAIGRGESAVIALAVNNSKNIASNNLTDVSSWVKFYQLNNITTGDILVEVYQKNIMSYEEICDLWLEIKKVQKMPYETFSEFIKNTAI